MMLEWKASDSRFQAFIMQRTTSNYEVVYFFTGYGIHPAAFFPEVVSLRRNKSGNLNLNVVF